MRRRPSAMYSHGTRALLPMLELLERRTFLSAGTLDPTWGTDGIVKLALPGRASGIGAVAAAPDGKIVGAGTYQGKVFLARFRHDGTLDDTFGDGSVLPVGHVLTNVTAETITNLEVLPNNMIFYAGRREMARFNPDGSPDQSFGVGGRVQRVPMVVYDVDRANDGTIYLSGHRDRGLATLLKYSPRGKLDRSWGNNGYLQPSVVTPQDSVGIGVHVTADDKVLMATRYSFRHYDVNNSEDEVWGMQAVRINPDGTTDTTYGAGGITDAYRIQLYIQFSGVLSNHAVFGLDDSVIITWQTDTAFGTCKFDGDGAKDGTWGGRGVVHTGVISTGVTDVALQSDGKLLLVGGYDQVSWNPATALKLARLTATGATDTAFATNGYTEITPNAGGETAASFVTTGKDGAIYISGGSNGEYVVARYWRDEAPAVQSFARELVRPTPWNAGHTFLVTVRDDVNVKRASIDANDIRVIASDGSTLTPQVTEVTPDRNSPEIHMVLSVSAPDGTFDLADNGYYQVLLMPRQIADTSNNFAEARTIGSFRVRIKVPAVQAAQLEVAADVPPEGSLIWHRAIGSTGEDFATSVAYDADGNAIVMGLFTGTIDVDPGDGITNLVSRGGKDVFVIKYAPDGSLVWARSFGGAGDEEANDLVLDPAGNIYITGAYYGTVDFCPTRAVVEETSFGGADIYTMLLSAAGKFCWVRATGWHKYDSGRTLTYDPVERRIYIGGTFKLNPNFGRDWFRNPDLRIPHTDSAGGTDGFMLRLDTEGYYAGHLTQGGTGDDAISAVAFDGTRLYTGGEFEGTASMRVSATGGFDDLPPEATKTAIGGRDAYVTTWTLAPGRFLYQSTEQYGSLADDTLAALVANADNAYALGSYAGRLLDHPSNQGSRDLFLLKIGENDTFARIGAKGKDLASDLALDLEGNVYVTGAYQGTLGFANGARYLLQMGKHEAFAAKYSGDLQFEWAREIGGTASEAGTSIAVANSGVYAVAGYFNGTCTFDFNGPGESHSAGGIDGFLAAYQEPLT